MRLVARFVRTALALFVGVAAPGCSGDGGSSFSSPTAPQTPLVPAAGPLTYSGTMTLVGTAPRTGVASYDCVADGIRARLGRTEPLTATFVEASSEAGGEARLGFLASGDSVPHPIYSNVGSWGVALHFSGTYPTLDRGYWSSCASSGEFAVMVPTFVVPASSSGSIRGEGTLLVRVFDPHEGNGWDPDPRGELSIGVRVDLVRR